MAKRPANPNTAYGRKRLRQEYTQRVVHMTPTQRKEHEDTVSTANLWLWIIVILVCIAAFFLGGMSGLMKTMKYMTNQ
jgi:hypothetical protein